MIPKAFGQNRCYSFRSLHKLEAYPVRIGAKHQWSDRRVDPRLWVDIAPKFDDPVRGGFNIVNQ